MYHPSLTFLHLIYLTICPPSFPLDFCTAPLSLIVSVFLPGFCTASFTSSVDIFQADFFTVRFSMFVLFSADLCTARLYLFVSLSPDFCTVRLSWTVDVFFSNLYSARFYRLLLLVSTELCTARLSSSVAVFRPWFLYRLSLFSNCRSPPIFVPPSLLVCSCLWPLIYIQPVSFL